PPPVFSILLEPLISLSRLSLRYIELPHRYIDISKPQDPFPRKHEPLSWADGYARRPLGHAGTAHDRRRTRGRPAAPGGAAVSRLRRSARPPAALRRGGQGGGLARLHRRF